MRKNQKGFSLIELLIVVAIILIIAAMAIPNLLRSKMTVNEASAITSLKAINTACVEYDTLYGGFPQSLTALGPVTSGGSVSSGAADLIDSVLSGGIKAGYAFTWTKGAVDANGNVLTYGVTAQPISAGTTGQRSFYTDQTGVVRVNPTGVASASSTPIG